MPHVSCYGLYLIVIDFCPKIEWDEKYKDMKIIIDGDNSHVEDLRCRSQVTSYFKEVYLTGFRF